MGAWRTYSLEDFLLFSPRVYHRLIEIHNAEIWPLHILGGMLGATMLWAAWQRSERAIRLSLYGLAIAWAWIGWSFFYERYATINWVAPNMAWMFGLQGVLLGVFAFAWQPGGKTSRRPRAFVWCSTLLIVAGVVVWPLVGLLQRQAWAAAELIGIMPDPTAVATIGMLLLIARRYRLPLVVLPLLWCVFSGLTLIALGSVSAWLMGAAAVPALVTVFASRKASG